MTLCKKGSENKTCEKVSNSKVSMTLFKKGSEIETCKKPQLKGQYDFVQNRLENQKLVKKNLKLKGQYDFVQKRLENQNL